MSRPAILLAAALVLSGCAPWDWRGTGRAWVASHCRAADGCPEICRDAPSSRTAQDVCR